MSNPQNHSTVQPSAVSRHVPSRSRSIVRSILATHTSALAWKSCFQFSPSRPCQKSPSQKIAIRSVTSMMSDSPGNLE